MGVIQSLITAPLTEQLPRSSSSSSSFNRPRAVFQHVPPPPLHRYRLLLLSANTPHVSPERHQNHSVSEHFNHVRLFTWFLSSSLLCTSLSRSGQSEPRPFTSAPTSFFPFPLLPFHYFIYFLSVHLAGLSQEMASCPRCGIKALLVSWLTL